MDFEPSGDQLPPLPRITTNAPSPKRLRRRPPFAEPSITATSALLPSSARPDQIISTLISSLSAISESARDQLKHDLLEPSLHLASVDSDRPQTAESFYVDIPLRHIAATETPSDYDGDSDEDMAPAPVIPMARTPPAKKKRPQKERSGPHLNAIFAERSPSIRTSMRSMRSNDGSIGVPYLERPNGSSTSLSISTMSARSPSPSKTRDPETITDGSPFKPRPRQSHSDVGASDIGFFSQTSEHERENIDFKFSFDISREPERGDPPTPTGESNPLNALGPFTRGDLKEHMIPSRRSSLGRSSTGESNESSRRSRGSRDLIDMNIDEDLIGSDDSTVRRIRELQDAREKRQIEWKKEAWRPSEKPSKRHSAPSPKAHQRTSTYQGSKLSVTEVLVESEHEGAPDLSAAVRGTDLGLIPAFVSSNEPRTPLGPPPDGARQLAPSPVPKGTPTKHSRPPSIQVKRTSTINSQRESVNEVRSISEEVEAFISSPRLTQKIRHPRTGRTIAFSEVGDHSGFVVFCCVGMGLTRYVTTFYDELARTLKLRLITPDRPGVGESEPIPERLNNPLTWVDDVAVICHCLEITRFSLLAHSAGAIYALATALKMPQFVRGRIHLLAPWIPPSQMPKGAAIGPDSQPIANLPMAHRILSVLPAPILKVANSRFLSATSGSVEARSFRGKKSKNLEVLEAEFTQSFSDLSDPSLEGVLTGADNRHLDSPNRARSVSCYQANNDNLASNAILSKSSSPEPRSAAARANAVSPSPASPHMKSEARASLFNSALTHRIWSLATLNANPAINLVICLERKRTIGFRYAEVTRSVVIHHGAKDSRVPLDNVRWLQSIMKRCELRVLQEEGHSLMASASVMSSVLTEMAKEWDEWEKIAKNKEKKRDETSSTISFRSASIGVRS